MNKIEALYLALTEHNKSRFDEIAFEMFEDKLESMVWEYYQTIEDELKEKMASNKDSVDD